MQPPIRGVAAAQVHAEDGGFRNAEEDGDKAGDADFANLEIVPVADQITRHRAALGMVHYILSGKGVYQCRGKTFRLGEGEAFLICPGELIYYEADREEPWIYTWIGMQGIKIKGYLERRSGPIMWRKC